MSHPKLIVNEYESLDDELMALAVGMFRQGRDSHEWVIDWKEEVTEHTAPAHVALVKQAFAKWAAKEQL